METVQLQCGNCQKLMAIGVEHMGGQVQCPHCQAVVQTPAPPPPAKDAGERESIFGSGEASEDVIGGGEAPPSPPAPTPRPEPATTSPPANAEADLTTFKRPPLHSKGMGPLIIMVFLIPYAILMTLFVIYLLTQSRPHPLEMLPDPAPGKDKGAPRPAKLRDREKHDQALGAKLKVKLGGSVRVGDIEVQPTHVRVNEYNELTLLFKAKNVSTDTAFVPTDELFVRYNPKFGPLYTFIESRSKNVENLYGGIARYVNNKGEPIDMHLLRPGEEATLALTTTPVMYESHVKKIVSTSDSYVWRVQLRRGFVKVGGTNVSATAVIGVEFTSQQIEKKT